MVKLNIRTDARLTMTDLRDAHILNIASMLDNTGRSTTPYKLSECYINLSPGRSMSLDQLFSLGPKLATPIPLITLAGLRTGSM